MNWRAASMNWINFRWLIEIYAQKQYSAVYMMKKRAWKTLLTLAIFKLAPIEKLNRNRMILGDQTLQAAVIWWSSTLDVHKYDSTAMELLSILSQQGSLHSLASANCYLDYMVTDCFQISSSTCTCDRYHCKRHSIQMGRSDFTTWNPWSWLSANCDYPCL